MFVVDTNVLLHAVNSGSPRHEQARSSLEEWLSGGERVLLTWNIVYEFLRVATHRAVFPRPLRFAEAHAFLDALFINPRVEVLKETGRQAELLRDARDELPDLSGSRFHDLHIALVMRAHGVTDIHTSDTDFHRFPWVKPVDPLR